MSTPKGKRNFKGVIGHSSKIISWDSASSSGLLQHVFRLVAHAHFGLKVFPFSPTIGPLRSCYELSCQDMSGPRIRLNQFFKPIWGTNIDQANRLRV